MKKIKIANPSKVFSTIAVLSALIFFLIVTIRRAWLSDDAYITLRTVDNLIHGFRFTWNITERVQAYTHPLWMLFVSCFYFFTHEAYYTVIVVSLGVSFCSGGITGFWTRKATRFHCCGYIGVDFFQRICGLLNRRVGKSSFAFIVGCFLFDLL